VPENCVVTPAGRSRSASACTSSVAAPSATPGFRLNDRVTEGICPEWLTATGPAVRESDATAFSGTSAPVCERMYRKPSAEMSCWYCGSSSSTTQYSSSGA